MFSVCSRMREMINWRQLYKESQSIRPEDASVSIQRICRLVNIYKNDMIEQDLHRHAQRLSKVFRCCPTCSANSYTIYRWLDALIAGEKDLFDLRLAGRSVTAIVYYWNKTLFKQRDERGQLSDFQDDNKDVMTIYSLSTTDENVRVKKHFWKSILPNFIYRLMTRFQMYYTYRKAQSLSLSIQVHNQPMKTFRHLFQTNVAPIFVCFVHEDNSFRQLFWAFRHLITMFNWPSTTKIFANRSFQVDSTFERLMMQHLGLIDLSLLDMQQQHLFCYIYRCLKTCAQNGPMVFLFDYSTVFQPKPADYSFMSFLCDLIRFDLSVSNVLVVPTRLSKPHLSFSQPFLFKEMIEFFVTMMNIQKPLCELIQTEERNLVHKLVDGLFLHLAYDTNQLATTTIEFQHAIACVELCQMSRSLQPLSAEAILNSLQTILKMCPFVITDQHRWNEITSKTIEQYQSSTCSKTKLISVVRKEYFLEMLAALSILSNVHHCGTQSRVLESDMFHQMTLLLFTFGTKENLNIRPCQSLAQLIQQTIQRCQLRNYIPADYIPQKSMRYRETILSDHEWSDDDDAMGDGFADQDEDGDDDEDEMAISDLSNKISETMKSAYRINFQETQFELKFFTRLLGPYVEALVHILKYHIEHEMTKFTLEGLKPPQPFHFGETSSLDLTDVLSLLRRAYVCRLFEHASLSNEIPMLFRPTDGDLYPLIMDNLTSLLDEFAKLLNCCSMD